MINTHDIDFRALPYWLKWIQSFKMMYKYHPAIVVGAPHFVVGFISWAYIAYHEQFLPFDYIPRFRAKYTVYRPDDPRLMLLPSTYITDKEYLAPDHPKYLEDRIVNRFPYVAFRTNLTRNLQSTYDKKEEEKEK